MAPDCPPDESEQRAREVARRMLSAPYKSQAQFVAERRSAKQEAETLGAGLRRTATRDPVLPEDS